MRRIGGSKLESNGLHNRIHCIFFVIGRHGVRPHALLLVALVGLVLIPLFGGLVDWRRAISISMVWLDFVWRWVRLLCYG